MSSGSVASIIAVRAAGGGSLYNGNIANWAVKTSNTAGSLTNGGEQTAYLYRYDQLHRIRSGGYRVYDQVSKWNVAAPSDSAYKTRYTYDPNGNITGLVRFGDSRGKMDDLSYSYDDPFTAPAPTNRLHRVTDAVSNAGLYSEDLDNQTDQQNYLYDATGNLVEDKSENMQIEWNVLGKVARVSYTNSDKVIRFVYDGTGNRVKKVVTTGTGPQQQSAETYYVREANGKTFITYESDEESVATITVEYGLFGSGRLGRRQRSDLAAQTDVRNNLTLSETDTYSRAIGAKDYEVKDHLGNVRIMTQDFKVSTSVLGQPPFAVSISAESNYYPFGMLQPGREWQSENYRYGFNGMEKDDEIQGKGNSYTTLFRQYDSRILRWLSLDPQMARFPHASPYNFVENNPILQVDPNGDAFEITNKSLESDKSKGDYYHVEITFTAAVILPDDLKYDNQKVIDGITTDLRRSFSGEMKLSEKQRKQLAESFGVDELPSKLKVTMKPEIRVVNHFAYVKPNEHKINIITKMVDLEKKSVRGAGEAEFLGDDIYLSTSRLYGIAYGLDDNTIVHEVGHSGGLLHPNSRLARINGQGFEPHSHGDNLSTRFNAMYDFKKLRWPEDYLSLYNEINTDQFVIILDNIIHKKVNQKKSQLHKVPGYRPFLD